MAQGVLGGLGGGVGAAGKGAEGGHIHKIPVVPASHVQPAGRAGQHGRRGLRRLSGQAQAGGKVVGAAHRVIDPAGGLSGGGRVAGLGGGVVDGEEISPLREHSRRVKQRPPGLVPARLGIDNHQQFFRFHVSDSAS